MCLHGVRASILDNAKTKNLRTIVVWIPMLDNDGLPAAQDASGNGRPAVLGRRAVWAARTRRRAARRRPIMDRDRAPTRLHDRRGARSIEACRNRVHSGGHAAPSE